MLARPARNRRRKKRLNHEENQRQSWNWLASGSSLSFVLFVLEAFDSVLRRQRATSFPIISAATGLCL
jgi:hypothetical protein